MTAALEIAIWGAGGHGVVVADLVRALGMTVLGFFDSDPAKQHLVVGPSGVPVIGPEAAVHSFGASDSSRMVALGLGDNAKRLAAALSLGESCAPALVHPRATVSPWAEIGRGSVVLAGAVVNPGARIGAGVIVNSGAIVEHDCTLGDGVHVSPGAVLAGGVTVGPAAWIGANATVLPRVSVGQEAILGAGAVLRTDLPASVIAAGVPARQLRTR